MKSAVFLAATALLLTVSPGLQCFAQTGKAHSSAAVTFVQDSEVPNVPANPNNPSKPFGEDHPDSDNGAPASYPIVEGRPPLYPAISPFDGATGASGGLVLDYVTPFYFDVSDAAEDCALQEFANVMPNPFLQVTDRRGPGQGWKVTAMAGARSAFDATILLEHGSPLSAHEKLLPPVAEQTVTLVLDGRTEQMVLLAREHTGMLTWVNRWYPVGGQKDAVIRFMPCCNTDSLADAFILWSLHDAP